MIKKFLTSLLAVLAITSSAHAARGRDVLQEMREEGARVDAMIAESRKLQEKNEQEAAAKKVADEARVAAEQAAVAKAPLDSREAYRKRARANKVITEAAGAQNVKIHRFYDPENKTICYLYVNPFHHGISCVAEQY